MDYSKLTQDQQKIAFSTAQKIVVVASAAAGKTLTLVARLQYLLEMGVDPSTIVAITFTNAASTEMAQRLGGTHGMFIGTIHAYANYLLLRHGVDTSNILQDEKFDLLFPLIKDHPDCIQPVNHLLLDEAQDSTSEQFEFLLNMVKPKNYLLVGDHRQSIYRWRDATPDYILDLMEHCDVTTYYLNKNYRNGRKILEFAKNIIQQAGYEYRDNSIAMRDTDGKVIVVEYSPEAIASAIKKRGNYRSWFVLARFNEQVDEMIRELEKQEIPCLSFKRAQLTNTELQELVQQDRVKVLTIHTSKGLEADNVVVIGTRFYNIEEKCINYVAATRARDLLVWTTAPSKKKTPKVVSWER